MMPSERRQKPRVRFEDSVQVRCVVSSKSGHIFEVQGDTTHAQACDLCETGLRLRVKGVLDPQTILKVNFEIKKKPVDVYARVVWATPEHCGLRFLVLDKECGKYIRDYVASSGN